MKKRGVKPETTLQLETGTVVRSTGATIWVQRPGGDWLPCIVVGKFRIQDLNSTNPVAVGDYVRYAVQDDGVQGMIREILPRQNYLLRKAISHARKVHILCANIDQAILIFTVDQPYTSLGFAHRFLVSAESCSVPVQVLINKKDLIHTPEQVERAAEAEQAFRLAGYPVTRVSAFDPADRMVVTAMLRDRKTFICGHSGAGKSALVNLAAKDLQLKTGEISDYTGKGKHTTTYAEMYPLPFGGAIIDSPGIKELGLAEMDVQALGACFPEITARLGTCRFGNCLHLSEPGCAVRTAAETGEIHPSRYDAYLRMVEELRAG
ncbi:MAG: ribosome small subunit-dependent GTPase A [Bacteroidia bacterium]|nr:ribosome small subunit-dependent GTPase A [Bacteroidia bacterium]